MRDWANDRLAWGTAPLKPCFYHGINVNAWNSQLRAGGSHLSQFTNVVIGKSMNKATEFIMCSQDKAELNYWCPHSPKELLDLFFVECV